jgi:hypothetical protein
MLTAQTGRIRSWYDGAAHTGRVYNFYDGSTDETKKWDDENARIKLRKHFSLY